MKIKCKNFGFTPDGQEVFIFTLSHNNISVEVINFGATIVSINTPDKCGHIDNIVLNYKNMDGYLQNPYYFGSTIGRFCNRIANGRFTLNNKTYQLEQNDNRNHLHGGRYGFSHVLWNTEIIEEDNNLKLKMSHFSPDGEGGYPGNLNVSVCYSLDDSNMLMLEYTAISDCDTIINLTNHSYFNLAGSGNGDILNHNLMINSESFLPIDNQAIPTGEIVNVKGTPFDFSKKIKISDQMDFADYHIALANGYNHNFILKQDIDELTYAAELNEENSGRCMEIRTTEPGLQFYSGYFIGESMDDFVSQKYGRYHGLCLETQHFPNAPNQPQFPSVVLKKNIHFMSKTVYKFKLVV